MTKFVVFRDRAGEYRWVLVAKNGETVATSEGYTVKQSAINSAYAVKRIAADARVVELTQQR